MKSAIRLFAQFVMWCLTVSAWSSLFTNSKLPSTLNLLQVSIVLLVGCLPAGLRMTSPDPDEELKFVVRYGNHPEKGGVWPLAQDIRYDINVLKNISTQVHEKVFNRSEEVKTALVAQRELRFYHHPQFRPMKIDIIRYTIYEFFVREEEKTQLFHYTKGFDGDSIFYLEPQDDAKKIFHLSKLVCDVQLDLKH